MIRVEAFHKAYRETVAVADLSFAVEAGQVLGLVGPNGAGKTTTLRALSGILPPTRGRLAIAGCDLVEQPVAAKAELAYVPDDPSLFDALTVWEHMQFTASAYRVKDYVPAAEALIEQFELTEKRDTVAAELSRGMRQKTAICCALLHAPKALLLDEPLTGLDPRAIRTMKDAISERAAEGAAVIVSSHLLSLVEDLCSHLLILHRGQRLFCGPIGEARSAFADVEADATLEEVFLRATEA